MEEPSGIATPSGHLPAEWCPYIHVLSSKTGTPDFTECLEIRNSIVCPVTHACCWKYQERFSAIFTAEIGADFTPTCLTLNRKDLRQLALALPEKLDGFGFFDLNAVVGWASSLPNERPFKVERINPQIGNGLFATRDLPPNYCLGEYTGLLTQDIAGFDSYAISYPLADTLSGRSWHLSAATFGNHMRCINDPGAAEAVNARFATALLAGLPRVFVITTKPVSAGEQFFVSYGSLYWRAAGRSPQLLT